MPTVPACVGRSERLPSLRALSSEPPLTTRDLQSFAQTFAIQAETLFNGHGYTVGGTPLQLEVDAGALPPGDSPAPDTHQIAVTASSDARSGIAGLGKPGGPALVGEFSLGYIESAPQVGLHEIGHLLGFPDQYQDVLVDAAGHQAPPPPGITFNNDGSIQNPGAYAAYATAHGLDPATIKGKSVPNPGHEHDLMATTKDPTATFEPAALKSLAADAHHCDPPAPKHLVPVFPSLPSRGCASAHTLHPILDTPWLELALSRYRRAFRPSIECPWHRELAAESALVDYALATATTVGEIRGEALNTCDIGEVVALGHMYDQLYDNARNAASEAAVRNEAVIWQLVHRHSGYTPSDGFTLRALNQFTSNLERTSEIDSLIAGPSSGSCTDQPAVAPQSAASVGRPLGF